MQFLGYDYSFGVLPYGGTKNLFFILCEIYHLIDIIDEVPSEISVPVAKLIPKLRILLALYTERGSSHQHVVGRIMPPRKISTS